MGPEDLKEFYRKRGISADEADFAANLLTDYLSFLAKRRVRIEDVEVGIPRQYLDLLEQRETCGLEHLLALARSHYLAGNNEAYIYFTQVVERGNIVANMRAHIDNVLGRDRASQVFGKAVVPRLSAPPEEAVGFTRKLVSSMGEQASKAETEQALRGNAHGITPEVFSSEREFFLGSVSLAEYLEGCHCRSVETLAEHARTGTVWFEQEITDEVVDLVRDNPEILGGALDGEVIYWTKIPFKPAEWVSERSAERRRYLACHCPMVREVLRTPGARFPRVWCNCTAGYIQQRFNAVFGEETQVELLETVLDGDDRCRFAVHVPPGVRIRFGE